MSNLIVEKRRALCVLTLDRPEALNSLTHEMIAHMGETLRGLENDSSIAAVMLKGSGGRAFCAGGDIKAARLAAIALREGRIGSDQVAAFFELEYRLNKLLYHFEKPTIALMDGITMGGGVGLAGPCRYRIATEKTVWAMPEVSIGFFPDVGAAHYLARAPDFIGRYLAVTGASLSYPADMIYAGFATHYVPSVKSGSLSDLLMSSSDMGSDVASIAEDSGDISLPLEIIRNAFESERIEEILSYLSDEGSDWSHQTIALIESKSPTSVKVALRHVIEAENEDFDTIIDRDMRLARYFLGSDDLIEGVRAVVVDKDRRPKWNPATLSEVGEDEIDRIFNQNLGLVD